MQAPQMEREKWGSADVTFAHAQRGAAPVELCPRDAHQAAGCPSHPLEGRTFPWLAVALPLGHHQT